MDNTFTEIIFQIKSFFYNLIEALKFSNKNKKSKPRCSYNNENDIIIEDFETTYLFETDPI
jgi:predicted metal-binding protein